MGGFIQSNVFQSAEMKVGDTTNICMNGAMVKCRGENENEEGELDNVTDLTCFLNSNPGIDQAFELEENTAEALIEAWGSNMETNEGFFLSTVCIDGAAKLLAT